MPTLQESLARYHEGLSTQDDKIKLVSIWWHDSEPTVSFEEITNYLNEHSKIEVDYIQRDTWEVYAVKTYPSWLILHYYYQGVELVNLEGEEEVPKEVRVMFGMCQWYHYNLDKFTPKTDGKSERRE